MSTVKYKYVFVFLLFLPAIRLKAEDTLKYFTINDFFSIILSNHPVAKQADLLGESARQEIRISRGFFDPVLSTNYYNKELDNKNYYQLWNTFLRVPTWYGVDVRAGFERNTGPFVNGENVTPLQGLSYLGISVPIGQGMIIDERRSVLLQAKQLPLLAESERVRIINNLLLMAAKDYWDWMYYYNKFNLHKTGYDLSVIRFEAVKERVKFGDLSAIDTIEALLQVQSYEVMLQQSEVEYKNSRLIISNYLWKDETVPAELAENVVPSLKGTEITPLQEDSLQRITEYGKQNHPDLIKLNARLVQLQIEKRYQANRFLPKMNLNYNLLQVGSPFGQDIISNGYLSNNYRLGFSFSYPLFLREERGRYKMTGIKIQQTDYQVLQRNREIQNEIQNTANEWRAFESQVRVQESMVRNAEALRNGEQIKFENGESSIFLINARENFLISSQVKLFELRSKYAKTKMELQWAAGNMINF
jgi:outer membrane protein TolC